jgi:uncharacterized protein (DUF2235 family)
MKRLVICCDGTWQKLDNPYPTNVLKMAQAIRLLDDGGVDQVVYYDDLDITVLGCWDTVGSLGVPDIFPYVSDLINRRYRFFDTEVNRRIGLALHAVAVDELRAVFDVTPMNHSQHRGPEQVKQVWFPGDHECVGGGEVRVRGLSDIALCWMMDQVEPVGLALDRTLVEGGIEPSPLTPFDNQPRGVFRFTGKHMRKVTASFFDLHGSVKQRWKKIEAYEPENLRPFEQELDGWVDG